MLELLLDLLLPTKCLACNRYPSALCSRCWLSLPIELQQIEKAGLIGFRLFEYRQPLSNILIAFKDRGSRRLGIRLAGIWPRAMARPNVDLLMAAPSNRRNFAKRGFVPAQELAKVLSKAWHLPLSQLRLRPGRVDQGELRRSARLNNLKESMLAPPDVAGKRVLLLDDVVTTGATLAEMKRAIEEAGGLPIGFLCLAETVSKTATKFQKRV